MDPSGGHACQSRQQAHRSSAGSEDTLVVRLFLRSFINLEGNDWRKVCPRSLSVLDYKILLEPLVLERTIPVSSCVNSLYSVNLVDYTLSFYVNSLRKRKGRNIETFREAEPRCWDGTYIRHKHSSKSESAWNCSLSGWFKGDIAM